MNILQYILMKIIMKNVFIILIDSRSERKYGFTSYNNILCVISIYYNRIVYRHQNVNQL